MVFEKFCAMEAREQIRKIDDFAFWAKKRFGKIVFDPSERRDSISLRTKWTAWKKAATKAIKGGNTEELKKLYWVIIGATHYSQFSGTVASDDSIMMWINENF